MKILQAIARMAGDILDELDALTLPIVVALLGVIAAAAIVSLMLTRASA